MTILSENLDDLLRFGGEVVIDLSTLTSRTLSQVEARAKILRLVGTPSGSPYLRVPLRSKSVDYLVKNGTSVNVFVAYETGPTGATTVPPGASVIVHGSPVYGFDQIDPGSLRAGTHGPYVSLPAPGLSGRLFFPTDSPHHTLLDTGSEWVSNVGGGRWLSIVDDLSGYTYHDHQPGTTFTSNLGVGQFFGLSTDTRLQSTTRTIGVVLPWSWEACISIRPETDQPIGGLVALDVGTERIFLSLETHLRAVRVETYTDPTAAPTVLATASNKFSTHERIWLRISGDFVNKRYWYSQDGVDYTELYSHAYGDFLTPSRVGFGVVESSGAPARMLILGAKFDVVV